MRINYTIRGHLEVDLPLDLTETEVEAIVNAAIDDECFHCDVDDVEWDDPPGYDYRRVLGTDQLPEPPQWAWVSDYATDGYTLIRREAPRPIERLPADQTWSRPTPGSLAGLFATWPPDAPLTHNAFPPECADILAACTHTTADRAYARDERGIVCAVMSVREGYTGIPWVRR